jgi:FixJ family two-component response regulator
MGISVRTFTSAEEFIECYDVGQPGCLVLDIKMPGMTGIEFQEKMHSLGISLPVIMISAHARVDTAVKVLKEGALTLLEKPFVIEQLQEEIKIAIDRDAQARNEAAETRAIKARLANLTAREREVMEQIRLGSTNKEIASLLGTSVPTIDKHRWKVLEKMQVENAVELVCVLHKVGE